MTLAELMQRRGYSVRELAKASHVGPTTINYIRKGRDGKPYYAGPTVRRKLSKTLGVDASDINEFLAAIEHYLKQETPSAIDNNQQ
jgi:transcriptional regulator with XRE-family HTH domain